MDWLEAFGDGEDVFCVTITGGLSKGKVRIAHCMNEGAVRKPKELICASMDQVEIQIHRCSGLCSYYVVKGGLLTGFEKC